jgi:DNA-binding response OmpR family regulator
MLEVVVVGPVVWIGCALRVVGVVLGVDVVGADPRSDVVAALRRWMEGQLAELVACAERRPGWPVRGRLLVDGVWRATFLFVSPGRGLPWMVWLLDGQLGEEALAGGGVVQGSGASFEFVPEDRIETCGLVVDWRLGVSLAGRRRRGSPERARLLSELARHPGIVYSRWELLREVWDGAMANETVVDSMIHRIRPAPSEGEDRVLIVPIPGIGYRFDGLGPGAELVELGDLRVDRFRGRVWDGRDELRLTFGEGRLVSFLAQHKGLVFSIAELSRLVWGTDWEEEDARACLASLAGKLREHGDPIVSVESGVRFGPARGELVFGDFSIDPAGRSASIGGRDLGLADLDFDLLWWLVTHPNMVISNRELIRDVWRGADVLESAVTFRVSLVRVKLGEEHRGLIVTVAGQGYKFDPSAVGPG